MQQCVQIYLGLNFNSKNIEMLHEIKNTTENTSTFARKMLFKSEDINMNKYLNYLNKKSQKVIEDIKSNPSYTPEEIGDKVYDIYDDIADIYIFSKEVLDNWQLIANECATNLNIIYCSSTQFLGDDDELSKKILNIDNEPDCGEKTCNILVSCGSKLRAKRFNDINQYIGTIFMGFDGCIQIYGKDIYKNRDIGIDPIPIPIEAFNEYFTDDEDILIKFINIYFDFALKRYYNKYNTELLILSINREEFSGLKRKLPCGKIECKIDPTYIDFYRSFYKGAGKQNKRNKTNKRKKKRKTKRKKTKKWIKLQK